MRPGDSLTIALQGIPDPSAHAVQIDEQGLVSLTYIGTITAANSTTGELAPRIRETNIARNFYTAMDVSVSVTERYIYVGGKVTRPSRIIWTPDLTLAKAIQSAGGFTPLRPRDPCLARARPAGLRSEREARPAQPGAGSADDARRFGSGPALAVLIAGRGLRTPPQVFG